MTYTRILQCSPASVGLAQAHPNCYIMDWILHFTLSDSQHTANIHVRINMIKTQPYMHTCHSPTEWSLPTPSY